MKKLSKKHLFYEKVLKHFKAQYKDVEKLVCLKVTRDKKICGGEWINSKGETCIANSVDAWGTIDIVD